MRVQISSSQGLFINITSTFVELALAATSGFSSDTARISSRSRGGTPPYRIVNQTGSPLQIWSNTEAGQEQTTLLQHEQTIDWRFDDWRSLREVRYRLFDHQILIINSIYRPVGIIA
jgi:vacuolar protein sorting-associated protein 13A/C